MTLPVVESQIKALQERQIELIGLAAAEGAKFEDYDEKIGCFSGEKQRLLEIKAELEMTKQTNSASDHHIEEINAALDKLMRDRSRSTMKSEPDSSSAASRCWIRSAFSLGSGTGQRSYSVLYDQKG